LKLLEEEMARQDLLRIKNSVISDFRIGWNMINEEFMSNANFFSDLKLGFGWNKWWQTV
jgi:hypothetical protein